MTQIYQGDSVYRRREVRKLVLMSTWPFVRLLLRPGVGGLDWTGHARSNRQSPAAFAETDGRFAGEPDWENLSVATLSNDRRLPGLGGPYALQQNVTSIPV